MINTRSLKALALQYLPQTSTLRDVILAERDEITGEEFVAKLDVWLVLLRKEGGR